MRLTTRTHGRHWHVLVFDRAQLAAGLAHGAGAITANQLEATPATTASQPTDTQRLTRTTSTPLRLKMAPFTQTARLQIGTTQVFNQPVPSTTPANHCSTVGTCAMSTIFMWPTTQIMAIRTS